MSRAPERPTGEQPPNAEPGADHSGQTSSLDTIFGILASRRRRHALYALTRQSEPILRSDLAHDVASLEGTTTERVATSLYHVHLPKLADAGLVAYDPETGTVRLADCSPRFRRYLTIAAADERESLGRTLGNDTSSEC